MPFVKLDQRLLDSSLWVDRDAREIFITALLMAEPYELTEPAAQIAVDALQETGWVVPSGWYGFVAAAGSGILHRAHVLDEAEGRAALERLGQPDPYSRSRAYDGRRLVRVNGGWIVLNFFDYRDRDYTAAARAARYRERKRTVTRDGHALTRDITQAEYRVQSTEQERTDDALTVKALTCATCGVETTVSFAPDPGRPIYCRACYREQKPLRTEREAAELRSRVWGRCPHEPACADYRACLELLRRERPSLAASDRATP